MNASYGRDAARVERDRGRTDGAAATCCRGPEPVERLETVFEFVQPVRSRYVLALDKSTPMDERDHWKYVRSATRRFVLQDAGGGTELGILSFADAVDVHTDGLVDLSDHGVREAVASAIPVFLTQSASNTVVQDSCLVCAITQAISMLEKGGTGSAAGDVILLVTSGTAGADQVQAALALAAAAKVHVSVVAFAYPSSAGSSPALRQLQSLTDASGGLMTTIAAKGVGYMSHISMLIELGDALLSALHFHERSAELSDLPVLVHQREFGESASGWVNGSFYLDPTLGQYSTETHSSAPRSDDRFFSFAFRTRNDAGRVLLQPRLQHARRRHPAHLSGRHRAPRHLRGVHGQPLRHAVGLHRQGAPATLCLLPTKLDVTVSVCFFGRHRRACGATRSTGARRATSRTLSK